jgi:hypothetical protein
MLRYRGEFAKRDTQMLSAAFAAGMLETAMAGDVNTSTREVLLRQRESKGGGALVRVGDFQLKDHRGGCQRGTGRDRFRTLSQ